MGESVESIPLTETARVRTRHLRNEMIYRDLATHHTSTTYDLVYIEQRSKGRGITFP
jgi:hypothetical protein